MIGYYCMNGGYNEEDRYDNQKAIGNKTHSNCIRNGDVASGEAYLFGVADRLGQLADTIIK